MAALNRISKKSSGGGIFAYRARGELRWGLEFPDPVTGKRRRKANFLTHDAALAEKESMQRQRAGISPVKPEAKPFSDAVTDYLAYRKAQGRPVASYDALKMWWVPAFGARPISEVTTALIRTRLDALTVEHEWTPATRNNRLAQLSGLLTFAMCQDPPWIGTHPIAKGRVPVAAVNNARERWLTVDEMKAVVAACPAWLQAIVQFGAATGWRRGEIADVRKSDYIIDRGEHAWLYRGKTKSGAPLRFPLEGWVGDLVKAQVEKCETPNSRIFPGPRGGDPRAEIKRQFPKAVAVAKLTYGRSDIQGVTFHTLRHTMASHALQVGVSERQVMELGNWKDHRMVRRYSHLADSGRRDAAAAVAEAFAPAPIRPPKLRAVR